MNTEEKTIINNASDCIRTIYQPNEHTLINACNQTATTVENGVVQDVGLGVAMLAFIAIALGIVYGIARLIALITNTK